jgi:hypothetical protein
MDTGLLCTWCFIIIIIIHYSLLSQLQQCGYVTSGLCMSIRIYHKMYELNETKRNGWIWFDFA